MKIITHSPLLFKSKHQHLLEILSPFHLLAWKLDSQERLESTGLSNIPHPALSDCFGSMWEWTSEAQPDAH